MNSQPDYHSLEQAAAWFATLKSDEVTADDQVHWQQWIEAAPEHRAAWAHIERVSQQFEKLQSNSKPAMEALKNSRETPLGRRKFIGGLVGVAGIGVLGWSSWRYDFLPQSLNYWLADYRTGVGEIRALVLAEGTQVWLSANTAIDVNFSPAIRQLRLHQGEILIQTAADARPFNLLTAQGQVTPVGTEFSVRQLADLTHLSVYDGAVKILTGQSQSSSIINTGEQVTFSTQEIDVIETAQTLRRSWARGLLMADDISLAELIAELAPFQRGYFNLAPELAGLRVMGTYPLNNIDETLKMLESTLPIRIERRFSWWINITAK